MWAMCLTFPSQLQSFLHPLRYSCLLSVQNQRLAIIYANNYPFVFT